MKNSVKVSMTFVAVLLVTLADRSEAMSSGNGKFYLKINQAALTDPSLPTGDEIFGGVQCATLTGDALTAFTGGNIKKLVMMAQAPSLAAKLGHVANDAASKALTKIEHTIRNKIIKKIAESVGIDSLDDIGLGAVGDLIPGVGEVFMGIQAADLVFHIGSGETHDIDFAGQNQWNSWAGVKQRTSFEIDPEVSLPALCKIMISQDTLGPNTPLAQVLVQPFAPVPSYVQANSDKMAATITGLEYTSLLDSSKCPSYMSSCTFCEASMTFVPQGECDSRTYLQSESTVLAQWAGVYTATEDPTSTCNPLLKCCVDGLVLTDSTLISFFTGICLSFVQLDQIAPAGLSTQSWTTEGGMTLQRVRNGIIVTSTTDQTLQQSLQWESLESGQASVDAMLERLAPQDANYLASTPPPADAPSGARLSAPAMVAIVGGVLLTLLAVVGAVVGVRRRRQRLRLVDSASVVHVPLMEVTA